MQEKTNKIFCDEEIKQRINSLIQKIKKCIQEGRMILPLNHYQKIFNIKTMKYEDQIKNQFNLKCNSLQLLLRLLQISNVVIQLLNEKQLITKRGLYYKLVHYYPQYLTIDSDINMLACNLGCQRSNLRIISSSKCIIFGNIIFCTDQGEIICSFQNITQIYSSLNIQIKSMECQNVFIVEKQSALFAIFQFIRNLMLSSTKQIYQKIKKTIFLSGKGYPDFTTRRIVELFKQKAQNIYYLGDNDIYGIDIYLSYGIGYKNFSTILPRLKWIDLSNFVQQQKIINEMQPLEKQDKLKYIQMMKRPYFKEQHIYTMNELFYQHLSKIKIKIKNIIEKKTKIQLQGYFKHLPSNWIQKILLQNLI